MPLEEQPGALRVGETKLIIELLTKCFLLLRRGFRRDPGGAWTGGGPVRAPT